MYCVLSLSPLIVLSTSFFPACYPFVGALTVCCFVYTCVYSCVPTCNCCIHACTQRRSLLLHLGVYVGCTNGLSFILWMGSYFLYKWALLGSPEGLVPARRMDTSQLYKWARADSVDGFCSALWRAPLVIVTALL